MTFSPDSFVLAVSRFHSALDDLDLALPEMDRVDMLDTLSILTGDPTDPADKGVAGEIAAVVAHAKRLITDLMEADIEQIGRFRVERRIGRVRGKFDNRKLWEEIKARAVVNLETGEVFDDHDRLMVEHGIETVQRVIPSPSGSWNSKPLRELGINLDHFCDAGDVKASLIVRPFIEEAS